MSNIDTINVGGLDYSVEDTVARETATSAVSVTAYVENGNTASRAYAVLGTPVNWKGSLYYTVATIAEGDTLTAGTNLTAATNIGQMIANIKTYVGADSKLHFVDATGADSVLPFSGEPTLVSNITGNSAGSKTVTCTAISGWETKTADDFFVIINTITESCSMSGAGKGSDSTVNITKSYNASTGVLTVSGLSTSARANNWASTGEHGTSAVGSFTVKAFSVYVK